MLSTGPHKWDVALLWTMPVWLSIAADWLSPQATQTRRSLKDVEYHALLYVHAASQLASIYLLLKLTTELQWGTWADLGASCANVAAMRVLTGTTSCCSGIATAHELIHRPQRHLRMLSRMLLWTVLYDHFAIAHTAGHHRHAGTDRDFSTARLDETFNPFCRRSMTDQFSFAWRYESLRIKDNAGLMSYSDHRVLKGTLTQCLLIGLILHVFGWAALAMFFYQAITSVRLLEAVNYFQHWGLGERADANGLSMAWSNTSWFSQYSLLGLPLHVDHHMRPHMPFHVLRQLKDGPVLPYGYYLMANLIRISNSRFRHLAKQELHSKCLIHQFGENSADIGIEHSGNASRSILFNSSERPS